MWLLLSKWKRKQVSFKQQQYVLQAPGGLQKHKWKTQKGGSCPIHIHYLPFIEISCFCFSSQLKQKDPVQYITQDMQLKKERKGDSRTEHFTGWFPRMSKRK